MQTILAICLTVFLSIYLWDAYLNLQYQHHRDKILFSVTLTFICCLFTLNVLSGDWRNGKREGKGIISYSTGEKYEGEFRNGLKDGFGIETYNDGNKYIGEWKDEKKHGKGKFLLLNGGVIICVFNEDCLLLDDDVRKE